MTFFSELTPVVNDVEDGWDLEWADTIWLIASVDTFSGDENDDDTLGMPIFLGLYSGSPCWHYEFDDQLFAFSNLADCKARLATMDKVTTVRLFLLNLGDYLRYQRGWAQSLTLEEFFDSLRSPLSYEYFHYLFNRAEWSTDKGKPT